MKDKNAGGNQLIETTQGRPSRRVLLMIAIVIGGSFLSQLNMMVMSPALPSIMADFGISSAYAQWLTTIFMLCNGLMVPVTAYLIARFSTRNLYYFGMGIFLVGTMVCGMSTSFSMMLGGRVMQAVGAGILLPLSNVIMMHLFPREKRGTAMGVVGIITAVGPAVGPTLGGWAVDVYGWQYIFFGIVPFAVICLVSSFFLMRDLPRGDQTPKLDVPSVMLSVFGFGGLLYGFSNAGSAGWGVPGTWASILVGVVCLIFFVRRQVIRPEPLFNLRILVNPVFRISVIISILLGAGMSVGMIVTPIFLQNVLGRSAMDSGLIMLPSAIVTAIMSPICGVMFDKYGPRRLACIGLGLSLVGMILLAVANENSTLSYVCIAYTWRFIGMSFVFMPMNTWGVNALPNSMIAHANAILFTFNQVGSSIGTAILITTQLLVQSYAISGGFSEVKAHVFGFDAAFAGASVIIAAGFIIALAKVGRISVKDPESLRYDP